MNCIKEQLENLKKELESEIVTAYVEDENHPSAVVKADYFLDYIDSIIGCLDLVSNDNELELHEVVMKFFNGRKGFSYWFHGIEPDVRDEFVADLKVHLSNWHFKEGEK